MLNATEVWLFLCASILIIFGNVVKDLEWRTTCILAYLSNQGRRGPQWPGRWEEGYETGGTTNMSLRFGGQGGGRSWYPINLDWYKPASLTSSWAFGDSDADLSEDGTSEHQYLSLHSC
ncbi:hypothetical protein FIBSPDRAFT_888304 [Athelia psychrophila]|uniref:Uncharacterized protein n=1 Tax=Athelia psychrophila TaxID=1759441 RepID=A0A166NM61_9AGAM|nr:hypothetical protein FIBSPDRAFT_888304 [Fibularhizoctonia sp. CBS 109695]